MTSMALYTTAAAIRASGAEAGFFVAAKRRQYYLKSGDLYLNQNGTHLQQGRKWAWKGDIEQARACRRSFDAAAGCRAIPVNLVPLPSEEEQV